VVPAEHHRRIGLDGLERHEGLDEWLAVTVGGRRPRQEEREEGADQHEAGCEQQRRERTAEELEMVKALHPLGQPITAEDCAEAALYLASELAANVTGVALPVDGGYLAR